MLMIQFCTACPTLLSLLLIHYHHSSFDHFQHSRLDLKLVLNADMIKFMVLSRARNIAEDGFHITTLTGDSIEQVSECKYLDIRLDKKLTFKFHI